MLVLPTHLRSQGVGLVHTLALPDPSLTQWGLVTFQRVHCTSFPSGRATWRIMACIVHMSVLTTHTTARCSPLPFRCLCFAVFSCSHMEEHQNMRLPHGTTGWNHSYYTGIPHSAPRSSPTATIWYELPTTCADVWPPHGSHISAATPSSVSCPQVTHSANSPQVQTGPTRTATSDLMSATLAEAATQLSFAEFLERCILSRASQPPGRLFHTSPSHRTSPPNSHSRSSLSDVPPARSLGCLGSTFDARRFLSDVFPTHPSATPGRGCADSCAQCCIYRCRHPTTVHGVLHRVHLLQ